MNTVGSGHEPQTPAARSEPVLPALRLAALLLVGLGIAKWAAALGMAEAPVEPAVPKNDRWQTWAAIQGAGEVALGVSVWVLPVGSAGLLLTATGAAFVLWTIWEPPVGMPCPCLAGISNWSAHLRERSWEWRLAIGTWFFLVGLLSRLWMARHT